MYLTGGLVTDMAVVVVKPLAAHCSLESLVLGEFYACGTVRRCRDV